MKKTIVFFLLLAFLSNLIINSEENTKDEDFKIKNIEAPQFKKTDNEKARLAYNAGTKLMNSGDFKGAIPLLMEAVNEDPEFTDAMDHLGVSYRQMKNFPEAEKWYNKSLSINPRSPLPYINLAVIYQLEGKIEKAIDCYKKVIEFEPEYAEGYYGLGTLYKQQKDILQSIEYYDKAIQLYKKNKSEYLFDALIMQSYNFYNLKKYDACLVILEDAKTEHPEDQNLISFYNEVKKLAE